MSTGSPTPGWAQGCAASIIGALFMTLPFGFGLFIGWLIWH